MAESFLEENQRMTTFSNLCQSKGGRTVNTFEEHNMCLNIGGTTNFRPSILVMLGLFCLCFFHRSKLKEEEIYVNSNYLSRWGSQRIFIWG